MPISTVHSPIIVNRRIDERCAREAGAVAVRRQLIQASFPLSTVCLTPVRSLSWPSPVRLHIMNMPRAENRSLKFFDAHNLLIFLILTVLALLRTTLVAEVRAAFFFQPVDEAL